MFYTPNPGGLLVGRTVSTSPSFTVGLGPPVVRPFRDRSPGSERPYDVMRDGVGFVFVGTVMEEETNPGGAPVLNSVIQVVVNWFEELKTLAPVR